MKFAATGEGYAHLGLAELPVLHSRFEEAPLLEQLVGIFRVADTIEGKHEHSQIRMVFTKEEVVVVTEVLSPLVGGLVRDQYMGHITPAWLTVLEGILRPMGIYLTYEGLALTEEFAEITEGEVVTHLTMRFLP